MGILHKPRAFFLPNPQPSNSQFLSLEESRRVAISRPEWVLTAWRCGGVSGEQQPPKNFLKNLWNLEFWESKIEELKCWVLKFNLGLTMPYPSLGKCLWGYFFPLDCCLSGIQNDVEGFLGRRGNVGEIVFSPVVSDV